MISCFERKSPIWGWAVAKELLNFWPKSQAEDWATEFSIKMRNMRTKNRLDHWTQPRMFSNRLNWKKTKIDEKTVRRLTGLLWFAFGVVIAFCFWNQVSRIRTTEGVEGDRHAISYTFHSIFTISIQFSFYNFNPPAIHRHAVMYETEVSRHAVVRSPNYQKTMITKKMRFVYNGIP